MKKKWKCVLPGRDGCRFMLSRYVAMVILCLSMLNIYSCKDEEGAGTYNPDVPVSVAAIMPETGGIQTPVVIEGRNFGTDKKNIEVFFNGHKALVVNVKNDFIYAMVPKCEGGETEVKVVVDGKNEGVLKNGFDYIVSSKVTTIASEFFTQMKDLVAVSIDDEDNLIVCEYSTIKLYSVKDNALSTILKLDNSWNFIGGCFSEDYKTYYVLPERLTKAVVVGLDKTNNWNREMIFDSEEVCKGVSPEALTMGDEGIIYIWGETSSAGVVFKVNTKTQQVTKYGTVANKGFTRIAFNSKDKYIYATHRYNGQVFRFPTLKETLTNDDIELVTGKIMSPPEEIDGSFTEACFTYPTGIGSDADGFLYITDNGGHTIRKIDLDKKLVTTMAGKGWDLGYRDGSAEESRFTYPEDLAVTPEGILYVMEYRDYGNTTVLRLRCVAVQ